MLLRCPNKIEENTVFKEAHANICGGHFSTLALDNKILNVGYYWLTIHEDVKNFIRRGVNHVRGTPTCLVHAPAYGLIPSNRHGHSPLGHLISSVKETLYPQRDISSLS